MLHIETTEVTEDVARQKEPVALLKAKGNSHYSKEYLEEREASEVKVLHTQIIPPENLPAKHHNDFMYFARILDDTGIWSELDADMLAEYLLAREKKNNAEAMYRKAVKEGNIDAVEKAARVQDKFFQQCFKLAGSMGLTITGRCKLVLPKTETVEPENRFAKFTK